MVTVRTLVVVWVVVLAAVSPGVAVGVDRADAPQASIAGAQVDADDVLLAIDLRPDGTAEWRIEYRIRLDDENATAAFESLQQDVEANPENYTQPFRERMVTTADAAQQATGREMSIENVSVSAQTEQLPREYGVVTYRFTWTGFAVVEDSRIRAGDALAGMFLDSSSTLLVSWPGDYRLESVDPEPDDRSENAVSWSGPLEFTDQQPTLVFTSQTTSGTPGPLTAIVLVVIVLAIVLGAVWYRREGSLPGPIGGGTTDRAEGDVASGGGDAEQGASADAGTEASGGEGTENRGGPSGPEGGEDGSTTAGGATGVDQDVPDELLSNEERVLRLLETHGGRIKQQQVVEELDWTEAKTSQVVSDLREADKIETFRIGRENVLTLPGEDEL
jgi:hypothetical protein